MANAGHEAASMSTAAAQLELAMRESQAPVGELAASLERMGDALAHLRAGLGTTADDHLKSSCRDLQHELFGCMQSLQFYDRMVQHLAHLRDSMAAGPHGAGADWREKLRARLLSDAQREAFDLLLPQPAAAGAAVARGQEPHKAGREGSVELF
jgi:hypothetical protein